MLEIRLLFQLNQNLKTPQPLSCQYFVSTFDEIEVKISFPTTRIKVTKGVDHRQELLNEIIHFPPSVESFGAIHKTIFYAPLSKLAWNLRHPCKKPTVSIIVHASLANLEAESNKYVIGHHFVAFYEHTVFLQ